MEVARACAEAIATIFPMEKTKPMSKTISTYYHNTLKDSHCNIMISPDSDVLSIDFYVDGSHVKNEEFPGKSIHYLESAAENWCFGIKEI